LEPYPGKGPHHGELATNWGDIFREIRVPKPGTEGETELVYVHIGRADDTLRITSNGTDLNASGYEAELGSLLEPRLAELGGWRLDTLQLFGSGLPSTALVIQLQGEKTWDEALLQNLREGVDDVNAGLGLAWPLSVNPYKRMLVVVTDAKESRVTYTGDGIGDTSRWKDLYLLQTHKHTLRRWKNVQTFKPWLDQLDWN
jgi:hypothetical protein